MGYTDKELRDATKIAYMDLSYGYNYLVEIKNEKISMVYGENL